MPERTGTRIAAIDVGRRSALTEDGRVVPILKFYDSDGEEQDHAEEAIACMAGGPGEWFAINIADFSEKPQ